MTGTSLTWAGRLRLWVRALVMRSAFLAADVFGFWRYPSRLDTHLLRRSRMARLYWTYKASRPVVRAEKNSGIEEYFKARRTDSRTPLLPEGFETAQSVAVSAVGDLMRAPGLGNSRDRFYGRIHQLIFDADVTFANLESSVIDVDPAKGLLSVEVSEEEFDAFIGHNGSQYDVLSTANNHTLDGGFAGVLTTHKLLDARGIQHVGTSLTAADQLKGAVVTVNGIKIAFLAATFSVNHQPIPPDKPYLVNFIPFHAHKEHTDTSLIERQIRWCRQQGTDLVVLSLHWGSDYEFYPRPFHLTVAHRLVESGVDLILSHHTHTALPFEIYQSARDPHRKVPILYGLGNLSSWSTAPYRCLSVVARFQVAKGCIDGVTKTLVDRVAVTPVLQVQRGAGGESFQELSTLRDLVAAGGAEEKSAFVQQAVPYADLVLGRTWRDEGA